MRYFDESGKKVFPPTATHYLHTRRGEVEARASFGLRGSASVKLTIDGAGGPEVVLFDMTPDGIIRLGRMLVEEGLILQRDAATGPADQELAGYAGFPALQSAEQAANG